MPKVYFVEAEGLGLVKIGTASDVAKRLADLQNSSPAQLRLLATIRGDIESERQHHERFKDYRHHGEWFSLAGHLSEYINDLTANPEPPEAAVSIKWRGLTLRATPTQFFRWMESLFGPDFLDAHAALSLSKPTVKHWWDDAQEGRCSISEYGLRKLADAQAHHDLLISAKARGPFKIVYVNDHRRDFEVPTNVSA